LRPRLKGQPDAEQEVVNCVKKGNLIDALSGICRAIGLEEFGRTLQDLLNDDGHDIPPLAKAIADLKPGLVVTTNLDGLLERALQWTAITRMGQDSASQQHVVLKIHGTLRERDTWVFIREQYDTAIQANPNLEDTMRALYLTREILFVGYGLEDADFDLVLSRVRALSRAGAVPVHFAILPKLGPNRRAVLRAAGIRAIEYENARGDHSEVLTILRELAPPPPTVAPAPPSDDELLARVGNPDPLVSAPAAASLANRATANLGILERVLDVPAEGESAQQAVRSVLARHAAASSTPLIDRIKTAHYRWPLAARAAALFDPAHEESASDGLFEIVQAAPVDIARLAIEAIGRCGRQTLGSFVLRTIRADAEKFGLYGMRALARMFVRAEGRLTLSQASDNFLDGARHWPDLLKSDFLAFRRILDGCTGVHADVLIATWLRSDQEEVCRLAARVLGDRRIARAVPDLVRQLSRENVRWHASLALGAIGSEPAVEALLARSPHEDAGAGLALVLDKIAEYGTAENTFREIVESRPAFLSALAFNAVGRRRDDRFAGRLLGGLHDRVGYVRGTAALALARTGGSRHARRLEEARREAGEPFERIFTTLALVEIDPAAFAVWEADLRKDLAADDCYEPSPSYRQDIIDVLVRSKRPDAAALADGWRPFWIAGVT
jgi:hypothetical protein